MNYDMDGIQQINQWKDIMQIVTSRLVDYFKVNSSIESRPFNEWVAEGQQFKLHEQPSWVIYEGSFNGKRRSANTWYITLLADRRLSEIGLNEKGCLTNKFIFIPIGYVGHVDNSSSTSDFKVFRKVIFKAITDMSLKFGIISENERSMWGNQLARLER